MLFWTLNEDGSLKDIAEKIEAEPSQRKSRWDLDTFEQAEALAAEATALKGRPYIATDAGPYSAPRYDVAEMPQVGDKVSYAYNGDYYPDGEIAKISDSGRKITTTSGNAYYRYKKTGGWLMNGMWSLVSGHRNDRNPSF